MAKVETQRTVIRDSRGARRAPRLLRSDQEFDTVSSRLSIVLCLVVLGLLMTGCVQSEEPPPVVRVTVPEPTATFAPKPTFTPIPSPTPANIMSASPTDEPAAEQFPTDTPSVEAVPTDTPTPMPTATAEAEPTETVTQGSPTPTPLPSPPPQKSIRMDSPEYGIQAFLWWRPEIAERDLLLIKDMGFTWVKQTFAWRDIELEKGRFDWSHTDHIVYTANKYGGLDLLIRVDDAPEWAAPGCKNPEAGVTQGPPRKLQDFADFLKTLVGHYKGRIRAYEIWNEPNLAREWCGRTPSPTEYAQMLRVAYRTIKSVDPNAIVISAGLTPTGTGPPEALPDTTYLDQLYQAMGGSSDGYFDVLGAHAPGYKAPPEVSPEEAARNPEYGGQRFFVFRRVEDLRAIMERYGDGGKQVAITEFGWTSDPIHPAYAWHQVTEQQKADYLVRAYQWAAEHWSPWIGVMSAIYIADPDWTKNDEQYWWAITNPDGSPRPAYIALRKMQK